MPTPGLAAVRHEFGAIAARNTAALDEGRLLHLADDLGVTVRSLVRLGVGWSATDRAFTFPMVTAAGETTGIRLRLPDGRKLSVRGSRDGLFVPTGLAAGGRLLIVEGPTDLAALLDLGFEAIGRPSCTGGTRQLQQFLATRAIREAVVVADGDVPGVRGGLDLVVAIQTHVPVVRMIVPPDGFNDVREWRRSGASGKDVEDVIAQALVHRIGVHIRPRRRRYG